jgi:hypothetical protein
VWKGGELSVLGLPASLPACDFVTLLTINGGIVLAMSRPRAEKQAGLAL